ncbi:MAG: hypothetical protein ACLFPR_04570, partial [Desulfococcaceae bacterium]
AKVAVSHSEGRFWSMAGNVTDSPWVAGSRMAVPPLPGPSPAAAPHPIQSVVKMAVSSAVRRSRFIANVNMPSFMNRFPGFGFLFAENLSAGGFPHEPGKNAPAEIRFPSN